MVAQLNKYGNLPMTSVALSLEFPEIRKSAQKLKQLERDGEIVRLKRGLYVRPESVTGIPLSPELIANKLMTPSYVSMETALRYYGLIPESVFVTRSMTTKEAREYNTPIGRFEYIRMNRAAFNIGIRNIEEEGYSFLMASPEKALCDLIANTPSLNLRYVGEAREYLEDDIRFDMEAFFDFSPEIFDEYIASKGKKMNSIITINKLLKTHE